MHTNITEWYPRCGSRELARGPEGAIEEVENKTRFVCQKRLRVSWNRERKEGRRYRERKRKQDEEPQKARERERERTRDAKERKKEAEKVETIKIGGESFNGRGAQDTCFKSHAFWSSTSLYLLYRADNLSRTDFHPWKILNYKKIGSNIFYISSRFLRFYAQLSHVHC